MNSMELAYRQTAVGGASGFGLMIAMYDTLAGDLRRAAEAERRNDIEARCREANHAFTLIAHLLDGIERGTGGKLADQMTAFYSKLRRSIMQAQVKRSPAMLESLMNEVLAVRQIWQDMESRAVPQPTPSPSAAIYGDNSGAHVASSWSA